MKLLLTVVGLMIVVVLARTQDTKIKTSSFLQSLKNLHRGPPPISVDNSAGVEVKWITQNLDHFDKENNRTWQMVEDLKRYMVNKKYFENGGPMFIYLGGEWTITPDAIQGGIFVDLAKEHKAILFYTEHRYYGASQPTSNATPEDLQYLHVKQALADVAHFIRTQRKNDSRLANSKVIIAGCSYAGSMVVWFSRMYPDLVNGGWASSAPIFAKVDFKEYLEVAGKAIRELGSQQCYNRIKNGVAELENLLATKRSAEVKAMLKLCNFFDHNNDLDLWSLFSTISNVISQIVQYQTEGEIPSFCKYLMNFKDDLTALSTFILKTTFYGQLCMDVTYNSTLMFLRDGGYHEYYHWIYQTCNEYGWYASTTSRQQPFGTKIPTTLYTTLCFDVFGANYTFENINKFVAGTNEFFGGLNPKVKNVYMTHGSLDPWSAMGHSATHGASVIPQASHCADIHSISDSDSPELLESKQRLIRFVNKWLA